MSTGTLMNKQINSCILIGAGDLAISQIPIKEHDLCIAVDGGYEYCSLLGIEPDYILGDFDSVSEGQREKLEELKLRDANRVIQLPRQKDDTDMLAAIKLGLDKGYRDFRIYGGGGGRLEHTLANIQCLLYLKEQDAVGYMLDGSAMILVAKDEAVSFRESMEGYLSLFSLGEKAVVSIEHMKYPLDRHPVTNSFPIGISNEFIGEKGCITVHEGAVVIIISWVE
ncbi:MAG: thiamine diphosphokinase [Lachnospiraceae bacterium]|nr:thiamine diphosphokinase [Lachnospiraceae bacterium]